MTDPEWQNLAVVVVEVLKHNKVFIQFKYNIYYHCNKGFKAEKGKAQAKNKEKDSSFKSQCTIKPAKDADILQTPLWHD